MLIEIVSALIGAIALILAEVVAYLLYKKRPKESVQTKKEVRDIDNIFFLNPNFNFEKELQKVNSVMMYTVNSHELLGQLNLLFERNQQLKINNVIILVRKKDNETPKDMEILDMNISLWKSWVNKKRIKHLSIIGYDHDPDHYYTIIGDKLVFCGQVFFDPTKPTGTTVNYSPLVFKDDSEIGKKIIQNYQDHFDNVVEHYKKDLTLFTTEDYEHSQK